jgi:acetyl-CoA carboxylase biotin carboxyl carrier protein
MSKLSSPDVAVLLELFDESDWQVLHLETGDYELFFSKDPNRRIGSMASSQGAVSTAPPGGAQVNASHAAPASVAPKSVAPPSAPIISDKYTIVRAPSLGTFYRAPKPGAPPYVNIGDKVTAGIELCLIEVMKLFTTLNAGISGMIMEIYVQDGELVEHDQPLFAIDENG